MTYMEVLEGEKNYKSAKKNMNLKDYKQHRQNGRKEKHELLVEKWFNNKPNMDNGSKGDYIET